MKKLLLILTKNTTMKKLLLILLCVPLMFSCGSETDNNTVKNENNDTITIDVKEKTLEEQLIGKWKVLNNHPDMPWESYCEFNQDGTGKWPGPWEGSSSNLEWKILDNDKIEFSFVEFKQIMLPHIEFIDDQLCIWDEGEELTKENATICSKVK